MKPKDGPFKYLGENKTGDGSCSDGSVYEAKIQLPDDGTPESDQYLFIRVTTHADAPTDIQLRVNSPRMSRHIASCEAENLQNVGCMLYGVARVVTTQRIEPM